MRMKLSTLIGMIIVISGASFVGKVVQVINTDHSYSFKNLESQNEFSKHKDSQFLIIGNSSDHLIWFLQISDLHISIFHDRSRITSLEKFANETVSIIKPSAVLASGDLTDAKKVDMLGSRQYLKEWIAYKSTLDKAKIQEKTVWLDIRGNHDNFDVPALISTNNFYQKYSVQGPRHHRSYMHTIRKGFDAISFIAVDACLLPGPRRPFNFIGMLTSKEMEALKTFEEESRQHNYTVWFGHYPTSCILSPAPGIRKLMGRGVAYLCGHLHTLGGLMPTLYTRQQTGSLELELGDWKEERVFRVAAIDHGLFSFVDVAMDRWPIILITNPKEAMFAMAENEPMNLIPRSTHIRVLVWSSSQITHVRVRIHQRGKWHAMSHVEGPLYVSVWTPSKYAEGLHTIEVMAADAQGRNEVASVSFALDRSQVSFGFWARAILMSNVSIVFQFLFGVSIFLCIIPLCLIRWLHQRVKAKKMVRPRVHYWFVKIWVRKLWVLCCIDRLFWPLILYSAYLPIGPWFIGEVMSGHIGVVFAWGTFVYSSYLPGSLTYAYGFLQILMFHCPLLLITAHSADIRFQTLFMDKKETFFQFVWRHVSYISLVAMQAMNAYFFWLAYGTMALILGPLRTWAAVLGIFMWYHSSRLSCEDLRVVGRTWGPNASFSRSAVDFEQPRPGTTSLVGRQMVTPEEKQLRSQVVCQPPLDGGSLTEL